jgi:hypothetical protein
MGCNALEAECLDALEFAKSVWDTAGEAGAERRLLAAEQLKRVVRKATAAKADLEDVDGTEDLHWFVVRDTAIEMLNAVAQDDGEEARIGDREMVIAVCGVVAAAMGIDVYPPEDGRGE